MVPLVPLPRDPPGFRTLCLLGRGGMATVDVAERLGGEGRRLVALKRLLPHLAADPVAAARFRDEARIGATLRHPNLVGVREIVQHGGELVLVEDYVPSVTLAELLGCAIRGGHTIPVPVVSRIFVDLLSALTAVHDAVDEEGRPLRLVHRDLSPPNLLVGVDGVSRLIDFGIAGPALPATDERELRGKFAYVAPEQIQGGDEDCRTDLFAVGVMLHEALTGRLLFRGRDAGETLDRVLGLRVPPPSQLRPEVGPDLDRVVLSALDRDPARRPASAVEFHAWLARAAHPAGAAETAARMAECCEVALADRRARVAAALGVAPSPEPEEDAPTGVRSQSRGVEPPPPRPPEIAEVSAREVRTSRPPGSKRAPSSSRAPASSRRAPVSERAPESRPG